MRSVIFATLAIATYLTLHSNASAETEEQLIAGAKKEGKLVVSLENLTGLMLIGALSSTRGGRYVCTKHSCRY